MKSLILIATVLVSTSIQAREEKTLESNKNLVRTLFEDCLNSGRLELLDRLIASDYTGDGGGKGPAAFAAPAAALRTAFPDIHYTIEDIVAEGDRVSVRWLWTGTHNGQFARFPPTGKKITNEGMAIFQLKGGRIARSWLQTDRLGFLVAIGAVPESVVPAPPGKK